MKGVTLLPVFLCCYGLAPTYIHSFCQPIQSSIKYLHQYTSYKYAKLLTFGYWEFIQQTFHIFSLLLRINFFLTYSLSIDPPPIIICSPFLCGSNYNEEGRLEWRGRGALKKSGVTTLVETKHVHLFIYQTN